jgi:glycolate oxidase iron-sulfur subunit
MKHAIPTAEFGPLGEAMAGAVTRCVHCGFCLPACPTYNVLGEEMDSPRGRIVLMKSVLEGNVNLDEAMPYIDRCLGCLGCVTACPSGVPYSELITPFRGYAESTRHRHALDRLSRSFTRELVPYPSRFRLAARAGNLAKPFAGLMPEQFKAMLGLLHARIPPAQPLPEVYPAQGTRRARVALLSGCVQQVVAPEINWATLRVLARNGVEIIIPPEQGCCGGLALHTGNHAAARKQALINLAVFPKDVDAVLTNAAGCGSCMHEYPLLFRGTPQDQLAEAFAGQVLDISVFLDQLGLIEPGPLPEPLKLAYHDACHLAHAQQVTSPPRRLLQHIPNLTLLAIPEGDLCCGSAGSYNIDQPAIAANLGQRKAKNILSTQADGVVTGNIGCLVQLRTHLAAVASTNGGSLSALPVWHTLEVLDRAYDYAA